MPKRQTDAAQKMQNRAEAAINAAVAKSADQAAQRNDATTLAAIALHEQLAAEGLIRRSGATLGMLYDELSREAHEASNVALVAIAKEAGVALRIDESTPPAPLDIYRLAVGKVANVILDACRARAKERDQRARNDAIENARFR